MCMSPTDIDLDDVACERVMARFNVPSKREAVNFALRLLAGEPMSAEEARAKRGSGWTGDFDALRESALL